MNIIDKILNLIGLQRKTGSTMQQIMRDEIFDHKWFWNGNPYDRLHYTHATVFCPECNKEKIVSWGFKDRLIKAREIKEEYELNKQKSIDSIFENSVNDRFDMNYNEADTIIQDLLVDLVGIDIEDIILMIEKELEDR